MSRNIIWPSSLAEDQVIWPGGVIWDIHKPENAARLAALPTLPVNCRESAECLEKRHTIFEEYGVFPAGALKAVEKRLRSFDDDRAARALSDPELMLEIVREYFYCG